MFAIIRIIQLITIISSDYCASWDIGNARFSPTQGSFRSLQLFGAGTHQVSWCSADILQSVSCKKVLRQSPTGPCLSTSYALQIYEHRFSVLQQAKGTSGKLALLSEVPKLFSFCAIILHYITIIAIIFSIICIIPKHKVTIGVGIQCR